MISALTWIPKGAARQHPVRFELTPEEYARVKELAKEEALEEATVDRAEFTSTGATFIGENTEMVADDEVQEEVDISDLPPELRMDEYDNDDDVDGDEDDDDEYAMLEHGDAAFAADAEEDEDDEDNEIRPSDSILVVALTEDDHSHLEVQLLSDDGNMFVHHDVSLPEFPLCLAWMDCPPFRADGGQLNVGNYCAVGTFQPAIEIWNLDVLDPLEPSATLGGPVLGSKKKSSKKHRPELVAGSHTEAVMGLSWNVNYRQALASGSADHTVKIWDVTTQLCSHTFTHHTDKAQSVLWHPTEGWCLATGSFDKTVALLDCRTGQQSARYSISADIEALAWDPHCAYHLYCATEDGVISCFDARYLNATAFAFQAHDTTVSSLSFCGSVPGLLATSSVDKSVRVWDTSPAHRASSQAAAGLSLEAYATALPLQVAYKSMQVGKLFALQFHLDDPFVLATGGDKGLVAVWESDETETIKAHFESRLALDASTAESRSAPAGLVIGSLGSADCAAVEPSDAWMDSNEGVVGATAGKQKDLKKKKKKDGKK